jgi:hypothetical protein
MNKLKTMLCAVFTLMLVNISTTANSDSSNFAGPYIGFSASGYGMQLAGSARTSPTGGTFEDDEVSLGQVAPITGMEVGYAIPIGSAFLIDIGAAYYTGESKLDHISDDGDGTYAATSVDDTTDRDVSFKMDKLVSYYLAPTLVLSDTSSLYVKIGLTEADVNVSGDITTPGNLSGKTWAMGTRTVLPMGIFIRTEAGYTDYNGISSHGKGTNIANTSTYSAEPTVAFGTVSLGFRF